MSDILGMVIRTYMLGRDIIICISDISSSSSSSRSSSSRSGRISSFESY